MKTPVFILGVLVSLAYAQNHDRIVGCYWGAWSFYRDGFGKFDVDDIDPNLCTHGYYGFADLDNATWTLKVIDPWYDLGPQDCPLGDAECHYDSYRRFIGLKKQSSNFKPMISIGKVIFGQLDQFCNFLMILINFISFPILIIFGHFCVRSISTFLIILG